MEKKKWSTQKMIYTAMLAALAGALMSLEISVPMMPPFYKLDFSDVPSIIAPVSYGTGIRGSGGSDQDSDQAGDSRYQHHVCG